MKTFIELAVAGEVDCTVEKLQERRLWAGFTEEELPIWNFTQESLNAILLARIKQIPEDQWNAFQRDFVSASAQIANGQINPKNYVYQDSDKLHELFFGGQEAIRHDAGKRQWHLVDMAALEPMIQVLEFGANKYSPDNWRKGMSRERVLNSLMRHVAAVMDGEEIDLESGLPHMGHIMCNAMFYVALKRDKWDGQSLNEIKPQ